MSRYSGLLVIPLLLLGLFLGNGLAKADVDICDAEGNQFAAAAVAAIDKAESLPNNAKFLQKRLRLHQNAIEAIRDGWSSFRGCQSHGIVPFASQYNLLYVQGRNLADLADEIRLMPASNPSCRTYERDNSASIIASVFDEWAKSQRNGSSVASESMLDSVRQAALDYHFTLPDPSQAHAFAAAAHQKAITDKALLDSPCEQSSKFPKGLLLILFDNG